MHDRFLEKITALIKQNISDERFGVSELAREVGMSRSNLLRTVKKKAGVSVSQYIRQIRLKEAMDILQQSDVTVSEVSYEVGFGSTSYFIKCFREFYGYPPGEIGKRILSDAAVYTDTSHEASPAVDGLPEDNEIGVGQPGSIGKNQPEPGARRKVHLIWITSSAILLLILLFLVRSRTRAEERQDIEKSIAVLPFINDSDDSTNVYVINGLMESILNSLQHIEDLRVISRTSVEKYRDQPKTIVEMAKELNVNYFVEGSGQKIGDRILLHIQLIEAPGDKHLLSEQYDREANDIFNLQVDVAKDIADKIQAAITPEEELRISKLPTDVEEAYDYFLKGQDLLKPGYPVLLERSKENFEKAMALDPDFARAYAGAAMSCYFLDMYRPVKTYTAQIKRYADRSYALDEQLPQALLAEALYCINDGLYEQAVPYLEEALQVNPNYDLALGFLADLYVNYIPNTEKYLTYALRGMLLNVSAYDSLAKSLLYLHVGNAFMQSGFTDNAETYIDRSLSYNPDNLFAAYVRAYILYARNRDLEQTRDLLTATLERDPYMPDLLMETGKICYFMGDYENAYNYFARFIRINDSLNLHAYQGEYAKIGYVMSAMGDVSGSEKYFDDYLTYAENDRSIYKHLSLAVYYAHAGDVQKSLDELRLFSQQDNYHYWIILFMKIDPLMENIRNLPEFDRIFNQIESKFWDDHDRIQASLEQMGLF